MFVKFPRTDESLRVPSQASFSTSAELTPAEYGSFILMAQADPQLARLHAKDDVSQLLRVCAAIHDHFHFEVFDHIEVCLVCMCLLFTHEHITDYAPRHLSFAHNHR